MRVSLRLDQPTIYWYVWVLFQKRYYTLGLGLGLEIPSLCPSCATPLALGVANHALVRVLPITGHSEQHRNEVKPLVLTDILAILCAESAATLDETSTTPTSR